MKYTEYDKETLKHLQNLEMMILKDFIKICEDNNLTYYMYAGSLLGTIRHEGFIPWDDDLDVVMFRDDFEVFKKFFLSSDNKKYKLLTNESEKDYFHLLSKFMLKNTRFEENWVSQVNFNVGINIDIFVLDDLSNNKFKRFFQLKKGFIYNKLLIMSAVKLTDLPVVIRLFSHGMYHILNFLGFTPRKIYNKTLTFLLNSGDENSNYVFDISANVDEYPQVFNKNDFKSVVKKKFEGLNVNVPENYDKILTNLYGDYMKLPPEDERYNHITEKLDFGKY